MPATEPSNPRQARLAKERIRLMTVHSESENVRVDALDDHPGSEPERYRVTFLCTGIVDVDPETQNPIYATKHQVELYCNEDFPSEVPMLRWVTPIWHPNIQHKEPKGVCVNKPAWLAGIGLDDLCRQMFEMVQYKNYHADETMPPYPLDHEVAKWVREVAEPRGIVNKERGIFVDNRPFVKPTYGGGLKLGPGKATQATASSEPATADQLPRLKITGAPPPAPGVRIKFRT